MIRHLLYKTLLRVIDKSPQKSSKRDLKLVHQLRNYFRELPVAEPASLNPSEVEWVKNMNRLRELVLTDNPSLFLRWDVILYTMFVSSGRYISSELNYLRTLPDWSGKWKPLIEEDKTGHPTPFLFYPKSSGNRIHHAYHLARFEQATHLSVSSNDLILEFGGGYGSLCRLIHKSGFKGRYLIFDLPNFSGLQRFYLESLNLPVLNAEEFATATSGICCVSDIEELNRLLPALMKASGKSCFIATWSLSESPLEIREKITPLLNAFQSFLIGYQDKFGEMENKHWFAEFKKRYENIQWTESAIEAPPGNNYLFGKLKN